MRKAACGVAAGRLPWVCCQASSCSDVGSAAWQSWTAGASLGGQLRRGSCCCDPAELFAFASAALAVGLRRAPAQHPGAPPRFATHWAPCSAQFTNLSKDFKGTLDYILYTSDSLVPCAVLDLPEEADMLRSGTPCLPNESWPSDHIALATEFAYSQQARHADPASFIPAHPI